MKIVITGFKPFLGESLNPSEKLALELSRTENGVRSLILPVEFKNSFEILKKEIESDLPDFLIMIGQAAGRSNICLEKIGLNWVQSSYADESGVHPRSGRILEGVDLALMSSFPVDQVFLELKKKQLPVEISFSAGAFVCNDLYFRIMHRFRNLKSIFVHVPLLPEQIKAEDPKPSLSFQTQLAVLQELVKESRALISN